MPLGDFEFRLDEDGVGIALNTTATPPFVDVYDVVGLDNSDFRTAERDWEGNDGGFIDAEFEKARTIVLTCTVIATVDTLELYLDNLKANWGPRTALIKFYVKAPGVQERFLFVKPLGMKYHWTAPGRRTGQAEAQFTCFAEDPRIYQALQTESIVQGATTFPGFGFSFGFDFGFGGTSSTTDGVNINNIGNRSSPAVFRMAGPVTNPSILNDTTGDELKFTIDVLTGQTLVVDTKYKTVRLDGVNRRNTLIAPNWFQMQPGDNFIRYRAESGSGSTLDIEWYPAWR